MKDPGFKGGPITTPILKDLMKRQEENSKPPQTPSIGSTPLEPANLYQDSGSGYNPNFTFPQD